MNKIVSVILVMDDGTQIQMEVVGNPIGLDEAAPRHIVFDKPIEVGRFVGLTGFHLIPNRNNYTVYDRR